MSRVSLSHVVERSRSGDSGGGGYRLLPAILAQLRYRVTRGEAPAAVLDDIGIRHPALRRRYAAAVAHLVDGPTSTDGHTSAYPEAGEA